MARSVPVSAPPVAWYTFASLPAWARSTIARAVSQRVSQVHRRDC